ncbi:hypothetical protein RHMOL_Rhmol09G0172900 [Rhododendron molle]|uniref:Uncharacterized protein n=1 Tax=Rhododendron molle TaxID=49168 RepID=A0ACC0MFH9_RHOML|nr:hypothetical protein RHMOL_Rhmol09G0172900 [Rhododendron molle]
MSNSSQEGLHILVFPYPAQGHMLPMLEEEYWDQLRNVMGQGHVWSGPLYLLGGERTLGRVNPDADSRGGVMGWLDGCPDGSVLYVCFGGQKLLESNQMKALASGLVRSWVRFIWVVKLPVTQHEEHGRGVVPDEFEDRVSGKGCWWRIWERRSVSVRADAMPDSEELAQSIVNSMSRDIPQRFRVEELRVKALEAVEAGGSSSRDLDGLVSELAQIQVKHSGEKKEVWQKIR